MPCHLIARNNNSNVQPPNEPSNKNCRYIDRCIPIFLVFIYLFFYYCYLCKNRNNSSRRFPTPPGVRLIGLDNREKLKAISFLFLLSLLFCYLSHSLSLFLFFSSTKHSASITSAGVGAKEMMVVPLECEL